MKTLRSVKEIRFWKNELPSGSIGFVPTMGALHEGHVSLIQRSLDENTKTVVSIFVNPTQFNEEKDFRSYPVSLESDSERLQELGVDILFLPKSDEIYKDEYRFQLRENSFSREFCGAHRPGHFDGVLTVVMRLLNIVQPNVAYFGEKDFQQLQLITDMVEAFFMSCRIQSVPTVRELSGLAMSSRNLKLSPEQQKLAPRLFEALKAGSTAEDAKDLLTQLGFTVDYINDWKGRRLAAASLGDVRLIDNVEL